MYKREWESESEREVSLDNINSYLLVSERVREGEGEGEITKIQM